MTDRWHSGRLIIGFPRIPVLRGRLYTFTFAVIVVTIVLWSPRISSNIPQEIGEDIKQKEKSLPHPAIISSPPTEYVAQSQENVFHHAVYSDDFKRLINLTSFDFVSNHFPCNKSVNAAWPSSHIILMIFVHSNPANFAKRQVIRDTWGSWANIPRTDVAINLIFLLGEVSNTSLQERLNIENKVTNDIVQGRFLDSYRNLTYKHVMGLKWCTYFCSQASYVLKTDDDVFVNTPALVRFLTVPRLNNPIQPASARFILCNRIDNARVKRSYRSKWHVTPDEYSSVFYPPYCTGSAILYSFDVVTLLYEKAQLYPYFWVDDVHVTGILSKQLNLTLTHLGNLMLKDSQVDDIISNPQGVNENSWFMFWKMDSLAWGKGKDLFLYGTELGPNDIKKLWSIINAHSSQLT